MNLFRKSWNDLIFVLKDAPASQEIISEINSMKEKWKTNLGKEEFSKIENELIEEFNFAKNPQNADKIKNKNDIFSNVRIKEEKIDEIKQNKNEIKSNIAENPTINNETKKKGFKKIQIFEEEIPEDNKTKDSEIDNKTNDDIDAELSN